MALSTFDFIIIIALTIFFIFGCIKGLFVQLYDIASIAIAIVLGVFLNEYVVSLISLYPFSKETFIYTSIIEKADIWIAFILTFLVTIIVLKIVGLFIKPILKRTTKLLKTTSFINRVLGGLLNTCRGIIILYFVVLLMMTPFLNKNDLVQDSMIATKVLDVVPYAKDYMGTIDTYYLLSKAEHDDLLSAMVSAYKLGIIDEDKFNEIFDEHIINDVNTTYSLTRSDKQMVEDIVRKKHALPAVREVLGKIEEKNE